MGEPSAKGEEKNACVLLALEVMENEGDGRGEATCISDTDDDEVRTLR